MIFGIGNVRKHEAVIESQEEMIDNLLDLNRDMSEKAVRLERTLNKLRDKLKVKPRRKQIDHKTGYSKVSKEESQEMYDMYLRGVPGYKLVEHFSRSHSCISRHIHKHLEENNEQQMV